MEKAVLFLSIIYTFLMSPALLGKTLHLAVASNFISPAKELSRKFEEQTGQKITLSFGSSGKLFAQIKHNAPYDIFLSADLEKPQELIKNQIADPQSLVIYAKGRLALWSQNALPSNTLKKNILKASRISIASPKLAPYGKAAKESLQSLSLWDSVQGQLIRGENISQTYQFVYSKNADIGFVALSQTRNNYPLKNQTLKQGYIEEIPSALHNDINQAAVILSRAKNKRLAEAFMSFLMSIDTQKKIAQFGYSTEHN